MYFSQWWQEGYSKKNSLIFGLLFGINNPQNSKVNWNVRAKVMKKIKEIALMRVKEDFFFRSANDKESPLECRHIKKTDDSASQSSAGPIVKTKCNQI